MSSHYLHAMPLAVVAADKKYRITFFNHAAEQLFETRVENILDTPLSELISIEEKILDRVFADSKEISLYDYEVRRAYGQHVRANVHISPVMENGKVKEALLTIEKPTGIAAQAASEWKKETTRAAGVMAAMLAHEVKNPLSGIRGAAQLLKDEVTPEQQALTELICKETDRIRDLLDQVEIFADGAPALSLVNIHEVLHYVIGVAKTAFAKDVAIKETYDPSLPEVLGHRDLLVQLFLNLVKNAAEALHGQKNATIAFSTSYKSGYRIQQAGETVALPVMVTVADNGPGIAEDMQKHLFEPFVSSKESGRGLGLAVVAKIAADIGAVVELDPKPARGASFNVLLAISGQSTAASG